MTTDPRPGQAAEEGGRTGPRPALGRGLTSLIPVEAAAAMGPEVFLCPLERIRVAEVQPRADAARSRLDDLAASIATHGVLQPVVVRREGDGFVVVAGERRFRAARIVGLSRIPVVVKDASPEEAYELALVENLQREDLGPIEEAEAYRRLMELRGYTQEELARRVGKDRATVANALRLLRLPPEVRSLLEEGAISPGHARAILGAPSRAAQVHVARTAVRRSLSVRATEELVRSLRRPAPGPTKEAAPPPATAVEPSSGASSPPGLPPFPDLPELPALPPLPPPPSLAPVQGAAPGPKEGTYPGAVQRENLGLPVRIVWTVKDEAGTVEIEFHSPAELDRILECLSALREG